MLFGRKKESVAVAETPVDTGPRFPEFAVPECLIALEQQHSYTKVAESLGYEPVELVRAQLIEFFHEAGINLYDYSQVCEWLSIKRKKALEQNWCWRPLREKDAMEEIWGNNRNGFGWNDGFYHARNCLPYQRLVPQHALELVAMIEDKFKDKVKFFVSDYPCPQPDPFIMVRPVKQIPDEYEDYLLVFDSWDEPGFGEFARSNSVEKEEPS